MRVWLALAVAGMMLGAWAQAEPPRRPVAERPVVHEAVEPERLVPAVAEMPADATGTPASAVVEGELVREFLRRPSVVVADAFEPLQEQPSPLQPASNWTAERLQPPPVPLPQWRPPTPSNAAALREAAWQLDEAANLLEWHEQYERADAVREMAGELRQDARKLTAHEERPVTFSLGFDR